MRNLIAFLVFVLVITNSFCQKKKIYYNEKYERISKPTFDLRLKSGLFQFTSFENDTAKVHKLRYREFFGKMDSIKHAQLRQRFVNNYQLNPKETWFINYIPSLSNPKKIYGKKGRVFIDTIAKDTIFIPRGSSMSSLKFDREKYNYTYHTRSLEDFKIDMERWSIRMEKKVVFFHVYGEENGFPVNYSQNVKLFKDPQNIIGRVFNDGQVPYEVVILHPTGDFLVTFGDFGKLYLKAIQPKGYFKAKRKWLKKLVKLGIQ